MSAGTPRWSLARATVRALGLSVVTIGLGTLFMAATAARSEMAPRLARVWYRIGTALCGLELRTVGRVARDTPTLYLSNHVSYLDMLVLGALVEPVYVAKREVASWPLLGSLARAAGTVFVSRERRMLAAEQRDAVVERLQRHGRVVLFPEGTTSDGRAVLAFKSTLVEAALAACAGGLATRVQPITLAYTCWGCGTAFGDDDRARVGWLGEDTMVPHLWDLLGRPGLRLEVTFHPSREPGPDRKALTAACRAEIAAHLARTLAREPVARDAPVGEVVAAAGD